MKARHFLDIWPLPASELRSILNEAKSRKAARLRLSIAISRPQSQR